MKSGIPATKPERVAGAQPGAQEGTKRSCLTALPKDSRRLAAHPNECHRRTHSPNLCGIKPYESAGQGCAEAVRAGGDAEPEGRGQDGEYFRVPLRAL